MSRKEIRKERPAFIGISLGFNNGQFRDFATSPLIYDGTALYFALSHQKISLKRESEKGFSLSSGAYTTNFNDHNAASSVVVSSFYYSLLYQIKKWQSDKWNFKAGGLISVTNNLRINSALNNNALGLEVFPTLLASIKIEKDISRTKTKQRKFLFIKKTFKERQRNLSFRLNVGVLNSHYRNGYVYIGQASILNDQNIFDTYRFDLFSGFRMSSALDYTITLSNKNKIQLSYLWDAYRTGGDLDKFEMSNHIFKLTLLFNTK